MNDEWSARDPSSGRSQFSPADEDAAASIAVLSEKIVEGMAADVRAHMLNSIDQVLDDFAAKIGRRRLRVAETLCTFYVWFPAGGGEAKSNQYDVEILGCEEMLNFLPFATLLQQISKDVERAFLKAASLVVLRDYGNRDYRSAVSARRIYDIWCARLITRDEHTHEQRRKGGRHRGKDLTEQKTRAYGRILQLAQELSDQYVPRSKWVSTIDKRLDREPGVTDPDVRQIRRILKGARRLP
jgi:hypothetical protein